MGTVIRSALIALVVNIDGADSAVRCIHVTWMFHIDIHPALHLTETRIPDFGQISLGHLPNDLTVFTYVYILTALVDLVFAHGETEVQARGVGDINIEVLSTVVVAWKYATLEITRLPIKPSQY